MRDWKLFASDVWSAAKLFLVQTAIPEVVMKIEIRHQGLLTIVPVQEVVLFPEEEALMHRIFLAREMVFLREVSCLDQISQQRFHSLEQIEAVDSVPEDLAVFLQDARFRRRLGPCRNEEVLAISQKCMAGVSVPFLHDATRDSLEGSREGEVHAGAAGFVEVEGV